MPEKKSSEASPKGQGDAMPEVKSPTFEEALQKLEVIVKEMEGGDLTLDRALDLFENGTKLSDLCRKQLEDAETRIEVLTRRGGEMQPQPFDNEEDLFK